MTTERKPYKFHSRASAFSFAYERSVQPTRVILGDDNKFWVVTPADACRLLSAGYEIAR